MELTAITATAELTDQEASDILSTALYDGITYWCHIVRSKYAGECTELSEGSPFETLVVDPEEGDEMTITLTTIRDGVNRLLSGRVEVGRYIIDQILNEDIDAAGADCIVQAGCFNKIVFG